jgi:hypothetical protein
MRKRVIRIVIASFVGAISDLFPLPGVFAVWLLFPQRLCSDHAVAYAVLVNSLNFAMFFAAAYYLVGLFTRPKEAHSF